MLLLSHSEYTVSLYPIGTFVYLSNRKVAEVIDTNPDNPKTPIVQLLTEKEADGSLKTIQIGEDNINILRILTKQEKEDILKLVREKYSAVEAAKNEMAAEKTAPIAAEASKPAPAAAQPAQPAASTPSPSPATAASAAPASSPATSSPSVSDDGTEEVDISIFG